MERLKMYADFNNADVQGRLRLYPSLSANKSKEILLHEFAGKEVEFDDEDSLRVIGILEFSAEEKIWVGRIDWKAVIHY